MSYQSFRLFQINRCQGIRCVTYNSEQQTSANCKNLAWPPLNVHFASEVAQRIIRRQRVY